jgi:hypothetical protein
VTTKHFLSAFGMETLRDLPDIDALEDAGLFSRDSTPDNNGPVSEPGPHDDRSGGAFEEQNDE